MLHIVSHIIKLLDDWDQHILFLFHLPQRLNVVLGAEKTLKMTLNE